MSAKINSRYCYQCKYSGQAGDSATCKPCAATVSKPNWEPAVEVIEAQAMGEPLLPDDNPKTRFGVAKPPLRLVPGGALTLVAMAFKDGNAKYGPANWREKAVSATTYIDAAERHIRQWFDGSEEKAEDSGCHHLAHAAACLMILLDAQIAGKMNDDRPPSIDMSALFASLTAPVK